MVPNHTAPPTMDLAKCVERLSNLFKNHADCVDDRMPYFRAGMSLRAVSAIDIDNGLDVCGDLRLRHDVVRRYVVFVRHRIHCDIDL